MEKWIPDSDRITVKCDLCGETFEPDPLSFTTVEYSSYSLNKDTEEPDLAWEGVGETKINHISINIESPKEIANVAICLCGACRPKDKNHE